MENENNKKETQEQPEQKKGKWLTWVLIGGLIFLFVMIIVGIMVGSDVVGFFFSGAGLLIAILLVLFASIGLLVAFLLNRPKQYNVVKNYQNAIVDLAVQGKNKFVKDLYLSGDGRTMPVKYGRIDGIAFIPYNVSKVIRGEDGKLVYKKDKSGKIITRTKIIDGEKVEEPVLDRKEITDKDGDTIFVVPKAGFPMNIFDRRKKLVRCNPVFHTPLIGDVSIKDISLHPYGSWLYPAKQYQSDSVIIMKQNEVDIIIQSHHDLLLYLSDVAHASIGADSSFQKSMAAHTERISNEPTE